MPGPLVYIDTCCFGTATRRDARAAKALSELKMLLFHISQGSARFVFSAWLQAEMDAARPIGKARAMRKLLPAAFDVDVALSPEIRVEAKRWVLTCGFEEEDALHVASAIEAKAGVLVTFDADFFEKPRQCKLPGKALKVTWLLDCLDEVLHGKAAH